MNSNTWAKALSATLAALALPVLAQTSACNVSIMPPARAFNNVDYFVGYIFVPTCADRADWADGQSWYDFGWYDGSNRTSVSIAGYGNVGNIVRLPQRIGDNAIFQYKVQSENYAGANMPPSVDLTVTIEIVGTSPVSRTFQIAVERPTYGFTSVDNNPTVNSLGRMRFAAPAGAPQPANPTSQGVQP